GYSRVVNIFKYMDSPRLLLIFAVHFAFCCAAYFIVARSMKKQVFTVERLGEDIDGALLEEVTGR
ncbi:MAG: hypothetical protein J6Z38_03450, partial [Lachnospiraceae bacterium]|nr:hypothetical protein [Lachnospiraceae bacterium]